MIDIIIKYLEYGDFKTVCKYITTLAPYELKLLCMRVESENLSERLMNNVPVSIWVKVFYKNGE